MTTRSSLFFLLCAMVLRAQDAAEVYRHSKDSVALIQGEHRLGSGVVIAGACAQTANCLEGWVVTNHHVITGEQSVTVKFANGAESTTSDLVAKDPDNDLAVLRLSGGPFSSAELGDSNAIVVGQRIIVISNPIGLQGSVTEGLVSAVRQVDGKPMLQISAPISPGSSGGPVFDQHGRVIGIATATVEGTQNVNLAIPSSTIKSLLHNPKTAKLTELTSKPEVGPSEAARSILERFRTYVAKEMNDEAEELLKSGIQRYEFEPSLRLEFAKLLIKTGRSEDAMKQLRITAKLDPGEWLPEILMGHLCVKRWLHGASLSDRQAAYQLYREVLKNPALPSVERQGLEGILAQMRNPAGEWITREGRGYWVTEKEGGGLQMGLSKTELHQDPWIDLWFAPIGAVFHETGEPGEYTGTSSYLDAFCSYEQSLLIDIAPDGASINVRGKITRVKGIRQSLAQSMGKKQVETQCEKPGTDAVTLRLQRIPKKEIFLEVDLMLAIETGLRISFPEN